MQRRRISTAFFCEEGEGENRRRGCASRLCGVGGVLCAWMSWVEEPGNLGEGSVELLGVKILKTHLPFIRVRDSLVLTTLYPYLSDPKSPVVTELRE